MIVRNFATGALWLQGTVVNVTGPLSYVIRLTNGQVVRRHIDHLRSASQSSGMVEESAPIITDDILADQDMTTQPQQQVPDPPIPSVRRSTRDHRPPDRFMDLRS